MPYGLEGFVPARHLIKDDGKSIAIDEHAQFMVIEFDRNEKRIVVSHTRVWEQAQQQEKDAARKEARVEAEKTNKAVKTIQTKVEKATLGDLSSLAAIRDRLQQEEGGGENK